MARPNENYDPAAHCPGRACGTRIASGRHGPVCEFRETPYAAPPEAAVLVAAPVVTEAPSAALATAPIPLIVPEVMPAVVAVAAPAEVAEINVRVSGKFRGRINFEVTE